jgi:hypothetical protein
MHIGNQVGSWVSSKSQNCLRHDQSAHTFVIHMSRNLSLDYSSCVLFVIYLQSLYEWNDRHNINWHLHLSRLTVSLNSYSLLLASVHLKFQRLFSNSPDITVHYCPVSSPSTFYNLWSLLTLINSLNAELNPIYQLPALSGAHHILHVSRIRVKLSKREHLTTTLNLAQCTVQYSRVQENTVEYSRIQESTVEYRRVQ